MLGPKLHHYVPQFYLRRFVDPHGALWVWDRDHDRVFRAGTNGVAAETHFYYLDDLAEEGQDPLTMEGQFSKIESDAARVTDQWVRWCRELDRGAKIDVPVSNRELVSLFVALQFLRTADSRDILGAFASPADGVQVTASELRRLHTQLLWDTEFVSEFARRIEKSIWMLGFNETPTPFITSDNPVAFRTRDNRQWRKAGLKGCYVVYPLSPNVVLYCFPNEQPWESLAKFDCHISPVIFTTELVESENSAQVFMASRFVFSNRATFDEERSFAKTIGTDLYAPKAKG